jgi:hypothetical protein
MHAHTYPAYLPTLLLLLMSCGEPAIGAFGSLEPWVPNGPEAGLTSRGTLGPFKQPAVLLLQPSVWLCGGLGAAHCVPHRMHVQNRTPQET